MKTWSYRQVTESARQEITKLLDTANKAQDPVEAKFCRQWAYGVYCGWNSLTWGWQDHRDTESMRLLVSKHLLV
jgi:hypothetical protein